MRKKIEKLKNIVGGVIYDNLYNKDEIRNIFDILTLCEDIKGLDFIQDCILDKSMPNYDLNAMVMAEVKSLREWHQIRCVTRGG